MLKKSYFGSIKYITKYEKIPPTIFIGFYADAQENKNAITFDIAPLIVQPSRVSLGYMRNLNERIFVAGELGHSFSENWGKENGKTENYNLNQLRLEVGYILTPSWQVHHFLSFDYQHINHKETLYDGFFESEYLNSNGNEIFYTYNKINYHRLKNTFNINYGVMVYFSDARKVGVIPKVGLGLNIVDTKFTNAVNLQQDEDQDKGWFYVASRYEKEGDEFIANFNFQVKFFYKF